MKFLLFIASMLISSLGMQAQMDKVVNVATSNVVWKGAKVTGTHDGNVKFKSGSLAFNGDVLTGGELVVDMTTIEVTDLQGKGKTNLEGHLKSDDFFAADAYPTSKLIITQANAKGDGQFEVKGNLTIGF